MGRGWSISRLASAIVAVAVMSQGLWAQTPDSHGEVVLKSPVYQGARSDNLRDPAKHVQNEGGSNGAGLCVIASVLANGIDQGVPGLDVPDENGHPGHGSKLWQTAKARPGGYSPGKLQALVKELFPETEKWASYYGEDPSILDKLSREGFPIGATMSTGQLYNYRPIHHMISLPYFRTDGWACVVDNNRPGFWSWMPAKEFVKRWYDSGVGWAWVWTRKKALARVAGLSGALLLLSAALVVASKKKKEST
jgi:hypothetical protein